jgi:hypothetical protein
MKRLILGGTFCLLICIGVGIAFWQLNQKPIPGVRLAGEDALVYVEVRDVPATYQRWGDTSLARILAEPSVQRFVAHPTGKVLQDYKTTWEMLARLRPSSLFFYRTNGDRKNWMVGVRCSSDLRRWHNEVQDLLQNSYGCHLLELPTDERTENRGTEPIDQSIQPAVFALRLGNWLLFGQSPEMLYASAVRSRQGRAGLEKSDLFQKCLLKVPSASDFLTYFQGCVLSEPGLPWKAPADVHNIKAVIAATTFDGPRIRDTVFTCEKVPGTAESLARRSLCLASPDTLFYGAFQVNLLNLRNLAHTLADKWSIAETVQDYLDEATSAGFDLKELSQLLESVEFVLDRDQANDVLNPFLTAKTRDPNRFREFAERLMEIKFPGQWTRTEIEGVKAYILRANAAVSFVIGIYGQQLFVATNAGAFAEALRRARAQDCPLERNEQYRSAAALVSPPTDIFVYLEAKGTFERVYPIARPIFVFGSAFIPTLTDYVDPRALPDPAEIARHLSPIVFSRHRVENGVLDESVGPVTAYQASIVALGACAMMGLFQEGE